MGLPFSRFCTVNPLDLDASSPIGIVLIHLVGIYLQNRACSTSKWVFCYPLDRNTMEPWSRGGFRELCTILPQKKIIHTSNAQCWIRSTRTMREIRKLIVTHYRNIVIIFFHDYHDWLIGVNYVCKCGIGFGALDVRSNRCWFVNWFIVFVDCCCCCVVIELTTNMTRPNCL